MELFPRYDKTHFIARIIILYHKILLKTKGAQYLLGNSTLVVFLFINGHSFAGMIIFFIYNSDIYKTFFIDYDFTNIYCTYVFHNIIFFIHLKTTVKFISIVINI